MSQFELHNAGNTEAQQKEAVAYLLGSSGTTGKAATGVLSGLAVSQTATASGSVLAAAGAGVAQAAVLDGASVLVNDSQATLDVFTANPMSSLPRNDIVVFDAATTSVRVIIGTPSATPSDPTVPTSAIPLARLRNGASATTIPTANIDDLRTFTYLAGVRPAGTLYRRTTDFTLTSGTESAALATVAPAITGSGYTLKVVAFIPAIYSTVEGDRVELRLKDGSGAVCGAGYVQCHTGASEGATVFGYITSPIPSGNVTMTAQRIAGTGNVTLRGVEGWTLETSVL